MPIVNLDENEWSQVIAIIANSHPLIAKISTQLVAQKMGKRNAQEQEQREREYSPAASRGLSAPPGNSHRPERGEESGTGET